MYPMVCTTLLRVFDCSQADGTEGRWLRADTNVECSSGQHDSYKVNCCTNTIVLVVQQQPPSGVWYLSEKKK